MRMALASYFHLLTFVAVARSYTGSGSNFTSSPQKELLDQLLHDYGPISERSVFDRSDITVVQFRVLVNQLVDFDERKQKITLYVSMTQKWVDQYLIWNPEDHHGVDQLYVDVQQIWRPDLTLHSGMDPKFLRIGKWTALVTSDGNVTWETPVILENFCHVRIEYFPFDEQRCKLEFTSWIYRIGELRLEQVDDEDTWKNWFHPNSVWNLTSMVHTRGNMTYCCDQVYDRFTYHLKFKRLSHFYILSVIVPSALLSPMTLLVFFLPPDSGEKISLAITNILALFVFLQLVSESMPPNGDEFPLIGTHLFIMVIIGSVSLIIEVIVLRMYHFGGNNVPERLRRLRFTTAVKKAITQNREKRKRRKEHACDPPRDEYARKNSKRASATSSCARVSRTDPGSDQETQMFRVTDESRHDYFPDSDNGLEDVFEETNDSLRNRHHSTRRREFEAAFILERAAALILIVVMIASNLYILCRFMFRPELSAIPTQVNI